MTGARVSDRGAARWTRGHPWIYRSDVVDGPERPGVVAVRDLRGRGYDAPAAWTGLLDASDPEALVPIVASPDEIWVVVAGGDGRHSAWMPAWNVCRGATEVLEEQGP